MKEWELACLGDDLTVGVEPRQAEIDEQPSVVLDPCPVLLWTTDVCLGFTSIGTPGVLSIDLPLDPSDGDLFDAFGSDESGDGVIEAHLDAVRGHSATFRFRDGDREFRCLVAPMPDFAGRTIGTVCIGLDSADMREDEVRYVSRVAVA